MAPSQEHPLHAIIIGAGIAGLTCALTLLRNGHKVTLLEKSRFSHETGAAVYVAPNASGLMRHIGVDMDAAGANLCEGVVNMRGMTGEVKAESSFTESSKRWKDPWFLAYRVDLHNELRRKVLAQAAATLRLAVQVSHIDHENATVTLEDGQSFSGDVVIGADGNNSTARRNIFPDAKLEPYGKVCYRFLVDRSTLADDPQTATIPVVAKPGYFADIVANDRKFVAYPCRQNKTLNFAAFLPDDDQDPEQSDGNWNKHADKHKMLAGFADFTPTLRRTLEHAGDDLRMWHLSVLPPLERFNKGRLALIGDAAHPFLPFLGQGAAQAMEDAVSVALLLQPGTHREDVPALLDLYNDVRLERANYVKEQTERNGVDEDQGRPPPSWMLEMLDYCFRHDEWDNSLDRLKEWREKRLQANGR